MSLNQLSPDNEVEKLAQAPPETDLGQREVSNGDRIPTRWPAAIFGAAYVRKRRRRIYRLMIDETSDFLELLICVFFDAIIAFTIFGGSAFLGTVVFEILSLSLKDSEYLLITKQLGQLSCAVGYFIWLPINMKDDITRFLDRSRQNRIRNNDSD
ncbi:MAG: hypothetical protein HY866_06425 [Chloroflexi bacterium]|nr:hypothetical protein [Chloroflexota bacterium]